jgi:hypothetical protein
MPISEALTAADLDRFLSGTEGPEAIARWALQSQTLGHSIAELPPDQMIALASNFFTATDLTITKTPIRFEFGRAFSLRRNAQRWGATPQLVAREQLKFLNALEIQRTQWLDALWSLTMKVKWRADQRGGFDRVEWEIPCAWDEWESKNMTWQQRANDLARRTGVPPLAPNTLLVKCKRIGLRCV